MSLILATMATIVVKGGAAIAAKGGAVLLAKAGGIAAVKTGGAALITKFGGATALNYAAIKLASTEAGRAFLIKLATSEAGTTVISKGVKYLVTEDMKEHLKEILKEKKYAVNPTAKFSGTLAGNLADKFLELLAKSH